MNQRHYTKPLQACISVPASENQYWQGFPKIIRCISTEIMYLQSYKILVPCGFGMIAENLKREIFFCSYQKPSKFVGATKTLKNINHEQS